MRRRLQGGVTARILQRTGVRFPAPAHERLWDQQQQCPHPHEHHQQRRGLATARGPGGAPGLRKMMMPFFKKVHPDFFGQCSDEVQRLNKESLQTLNTVIDTSEALIAELRGEAASEEGSARQGGLAATYTLSFFHHKAGPAAAAAPLPGQQQQTQQLQQRNEGEDGGGRVAPFVEPPEKVTVVMRFPPYLLRMRHAVSLRAHVCKQLEKLLDSVQLDLSLSAGGRGGAVEAQRRRREEDKKRRQDQRLAAQQQQHEKLWQQKHQRPRTATDGRGGGVRGAYGAEGRGGRQGIESGADAAKRRKRASDGLFATPRRRGGEGGERGGGGTGERRRRGGRRLGNITTESELNDLLNHHYALDTSAGNIAPSVREGFYRDRSAEEVLDRTGRDISNTLRTRQVNEYLRRVLFKGVGVHEEGEVSSKLHTVLLDSFDVLSLDKVAFWDRVVFVVARTEGFDLHTSENGHIVLVPLDFEELDLLEFLMEAVLLLIPEGGPEGGPEGDGSGQAEAEAARAAGQDIRV